MTINTSESKPKYQPYQPTRWEKRIDQALGIMSPRVAMKRMVAREKMHWFRYLAAQPTSARQNSTAMTAGEWMRIQREKLQVMWNAIDMVDNSGLCSGILIKFPTYVCGTLGWQARTGDKNINRQYQQYIKEKTTKPGNIDITRRFTLRQMCMLDVKCIALKGDVGTNIVRDDDEIYLQGIEANRIGDPFQYQTSQTYVRGLVLDRLTGRIEGAKIFYQDKRSGTYKFDAYYPMRDERGLPKFLFFTNPIPISFDDYRGVSMFKHAIDNATYIDRMRQYELQALLWAASQSGVYYTKSGALPDALPFDRDRQQDRDGNYIDTYQVRPNTVTALGEGEDVKMFDHERPSPNVIGMYENTVRDIAIGAGFTYGFAYDMTGITGPAVRQCSAQDARTIEVWQSLLGEQKLDPTIMLLLGEAIARRELPYHPNWMQWAWFFPAKPTIDAGRESEANIAEIAAGVNTGASVVADAGLGDVEDVITQRSHEIQAMIEAAQKVAQNLKLDWQDVYVKMFPPKGGGGGAMQKSAMDAAGKVKKNGRDAPGATDDPEDLSDEKMSQNGHRDGQIVIKQFFRGQAFDQQSAKTQKRDEHGRWVDEGGGVATSIKKNIPAVRTKDGKVYSDPEGAIHSDVIEKHGLNPSDVVDGGWIVDGEYREGGGDTKHIAEQSQAKDRVKAKRAQKAPELTGIDKKIVDYKPDKRPLGDQSKLLSLASVLPNTRYSPYSEMPFFDSINAMQGVVDVNKIDGPKYKLLRDELLNRQPVADVPLDRIVVTQPGINKDRIAIMGKHPLGVGEEGTETAPIQVVRYEGETYILNGHHRLADAVMKGATTIKAHVLTLNEHHLKALPAAKPYYDKAAKAKPHLEKIIKDVVATHNASGGVAPLKTLPAALEKVEGKYKGDWSRLSDLVRGRITGDTDKQVDGIVSDLEQRLGIKAEIVHHPESNYSDVKFNPVIEGHKVEIQVLHKYTAEVSDKTHALYEKQRAILRKASKEDRELTADEMAEVGRLNKQMSEAFGRGRGHAAAAARS